MRRPVPQSGLRHSIGIAVGVATVCAASSAAVTTITGSDEIMTYHSGTADGRRSAARLRSDAWCRRNRGR
jgi:hypothetical protein